MSGRAGEIIAMHSFGASAPIGPVHEAVRLHRRRTSTRRPGASSTTASKHADDQSAAAHSARAGQAVWLDFIDRKILENGEFKRLIDEDGLRGVTSNPSIFEKAIGEGDDYDDVLVKPLAQAATPTPVDLYDDLAIADIQRAADHLRPVYDRLKGADGYRQPGGLALSGHGHRGARIAEARRLWRAVDRPNLMIKVPGTKPGVPAIRQLIGEGINVNVTLLFGIEAYLAVAEAYIGGARGAEGGGRRRLQGRTASPASSSAASTPRSTTRSTRG